VNEFISLANLTVVASIPYLLAALGTMLSGRAGVFNVAQEGVMLLGACIGFLSTHSTGSLGIGLLAASIAGGIVGLILGYTSTYLRLDQFVVGLSLFFFCTGLAGLLFRQVIGTTSVPPLITTLKPVEIPILSSIPALGKIFFTQNLLVYFTYFLVVAMYLYLYRSNAGLTFRSVGENPKAADSVGISVNRIRMTASIFGTALMGVAGAYLPLVFTGLYTNGMINGRGWLAIALTFFGGWRPQYLVLGGTFFAALETLALRAQVSSIHIPSQLILVAPYVFTLIVMVAVSQRTTAPTFLGRNYDRESRTN
jgi:ABC-type uncharacterized transport system permease subunit